MKPLNKKKGVINIFSDANKFIKKGQNKILEKKKK